MFPSADAEYYSTRIIPTPSKADVASSGVRSSVFVYPEAESQEALRQPGVKCHMVCPTNLLPKVEARSPVNQRCSLFQKNA